MAQANSSLSPRNKFAKRHYEAIATAIQEARRRAKDGDNHHDPIVNVVDELCWLFRSDNGCLSGIGSAELVTLARMSEPEIKETHNKSSNQNPA